MMPRRTLAACTLVLWALAACSDRPVNAPDPSGESNFGGVVTHRDVDVIDFSKPGQSKRFVLPTRSGPDSPTVPHLQYAPSRGYTGVTFEGRAVLSPPSVSGVEVHLTDIHYDSESDAPLALAVSNFAGDEVAGALQVFDMSDPFAPRLEAEVLFDDAEYASVLRNGEVAYALGNDMDVAIVDVYDLADPRNPTVVERLFFETETALSAAVDDESLYVVTGDLGGLHRLDIGDALHPVAVDFLEIADARHVNVDRRDVLVLTGDALVFVRNNQVRHTVAVDGLPAQAPSRAVIVGRSCYVNTNDGIKTIDLQNRTLVHALQSEAGTANGLATDDGVLFFRANGEGGLQLVHRGEDNLFRELGALDLENAGSSNSATLNNRNWFSGDGRGGVLIGGFAYDVYDDFEGRLVIPYPWIEVGGDWVNEIKDGSTVMTCPTQDNPADRRVFWGNDVDWHNVQIDLRAYLDQGMGYGVYFRTNDVDDRDRQDAYVFQYDPGYEDGAFIFRKIHNGRETRAFGVTLKSDIPELAEQDWYGSWRQIRIVAQGESLRAWVDGILVSEATDDEFSTGTIGMRMWSDSQAWFDDIHLTELPD